MPITLNKYKPKLSTLMQLSDSNYVLLMSLLANHWDVGEQRKFSVSALLSYQITINEVTRYTSVVTIEQKVLEQSNMPSIMHPSMVIRLYHDARMAEVIASQDVRQIKPRYDYPNHQMHLPDEKQQIAQFLKEWLQMCLQHGHVNHTVFNG